MSVREAVEGELKMMRKRDRALADGTLAASALALAEEIDGRNSATSKSMCAKELRETMDRLRELLPEEQEQDAIDELRERRTKRRARSAGA